MANRKLKTPAILLCIAFMAVLLFLMLKGQNGLPYNVGQTEKEYYTQTKEALGTVITITLYLTDKDSLTKDDLQEIATEMFNEIDRLENIFSAKISDSELSLLNQQIADAAKNGETSAVIPVSCELADVLSIALKYSRLSGGALDISLGSLINLWGIGTENQCVPDSGQILKYANLNGWKNISVENDNSIKVTDISANPISLDLGAIAKGYIGDCIKDMAEKNGIKCGMLYLGGNIVTLGERYSGGNWTIGITDPLNTSGLAATVCVTDKAVVTSGNYERYFIENGVRYHHILDSFTGFPAENGIISSTIIGESSADCDALSTACYVLGLDKAVDLIENIQGYEAVFIDDNGNIYTTSGMDKYSFSDAK